MQNTIQFLSELTKNNNREWFASQKARFDVLQAENKVFFHQVFSELKKYDDVAELNIFRIYRDVRFSKEKSPYKTNFGAGFSRKKPLLRGGYYIHIEPGKSFVGGGFWAPNNNDLLRIRKEFELDSTEIKKITSDPTFQRFFEELKGEDGVKTAPKGFDKNHPDIDLIKKKQFVVKRPFTNEQVCSPTFQREIIATFLAMRPFFDYMSEVLTSDLNGESIF